MNTKEPFDRRGTEGPDLPRNIPLVSLFKSPHPITDLEDTLFILCTCSGFNPNFLIECFLFNRDYGSRRCWHGMVAFRQAHKNPVPPGNQNAILVPPLIKQPRIHRRKRRTRKSISIRNAIGIIGTPPRTLLAINCLRKCSNRFWISPLPSIG